MKTDDELKQLAADIFEGQVFTDRHLAQYSRENEIGLTFYPILFGAFSDMKEEERNQISILYEYMIKALPTSSNGHPIFMSVQFLTREEHERMNMFYRAYKLIKDSFLRNKA